MSAPSLSMNSPKTNRMLLVMMVNSSPDVDFACDGVRAGRVSQRFETGEHPVGRSSGAAAQNL